MLYLEGKAGRDTEQRTGKLVDMKQRERKNMALEE